MTKIKSTELANRLGISDSTIRLWADRYKAFLSPTGHGLTKGSVRVFTEDDQAVIATVARLIAEGVPHADIADELQAGTRVDPPTETVKDDRAIIPLETLVQLRSLQARLDDKERELSELRSKAETDQARILELSTKAASLETEARMLREQLEAERHRRRGLFGGG